MQSTFQQIVEALHLDNQDNYLFFFINSSLALNPLGGIALLVLFLGRIFPIIAQSPFLGSRVLPHPVKVCFAICLFTIFLPHLLQVTTTPLTFNFMLLFLLVKELFVGIILGFIISLPFTIVQNSGIIIDHQRGGASLMVNDPTVQNQSSPLGTLFNMVLIYIFFMVEGPFIYIDSLLDSFTALPPDKMLPSSFFTPDTPFWTILVGCFNKVMVMSIQLATPALLAILMTDFFLGIANRLAPQVQITFLGMPLKSLLALIVICLGWKQLTGQFSRDAFYWLNSVQDVVNLLGVPATAPY